MSEEKQVREVTTVLDDVVIKFRVANEFRLQSPCVKCGRSDEAPHCRTQCSDLILFQYKHRTDQTIGKSAMVYEDHVSALPVSSERAQKTYGKKMC